MRFPILLALAIGFSTSIVSATVDDLRLAFEAQAAGEHEAVIEALSNAARDTGELGLIARIELASRVVQDKPEQAQRLLLEVLTSRPRGAIRAAAVAATVELIEDMPVEELELASLASAAIRLSGNHRRAIEATILRVSNDESLARRVLERSERDLAGLEAARRLDGVPLPERLRYDRALAFYWNGLYDEAAPLLEQLYEARSPNLPRYEIAYYRGRCAFRGVRWAEAESWYRKAIRATGSAERKASYWLHVGRTLELAGDIDGAAEAGLQAVRTRSSDSRRLFLVRLRLRQGDRAKAVYGVSKCRSFADRDRGRLLLALDDLGRGRFPQALVELDRIVGAQAGSRAMVIASQIELVLGNEEAIFARLEKAAKRGLQPLWAELARDVISRIDTGLVAEWRLRRNLAHRQADDRKAIAQLAIDLAIEPDAERRACLGAEVSNRLGLVGDVEILPALVNDSLLSELLEADLGELAARYFADRFPAGTPATSAVSATALLGWGQTRAAIQTVDRVRYLSGVQLPPAELLPELAAAMVPMPYIAELNEACRGVAPCWLLAGLVREESRWEPRARSFVGARGLTQMMPATAAAVADRIEIEIDSDDALFDPQLSLRLGAAELADLLQTFGGQAPVAISAYNAGSAQAELWRDACPLDCSTSLYIASVTFGVTRGYVEKVLGSALISRRVLEQSSTSALSPNATPGAASGLRISESR